MPRNAAASVVGGEATNARAVPARWLEGVPAALRLPAWRVRLLVTGWNTPLASSNGVQRRGLRQSGYINAVERVWGRGWANGERSGVLNGI